MELNNKEYNKIIQDRIQMETGFESNKPWDQCLQTNSTYLDCPLGSMNTSDTEAMWVAVHNPSSLDLFSMQVAIPEEMNFNASIFNTTSNTLQLVNSEKVCYDDHLDSGKKIVNCKLEV